MAPPPEDIYWENLNESHRFFFLKTFFINFIVFIFLFFFTSPAYIISQLELILNLKTLSPKLPEKINDFLPTLLLWTLTALLPIIVAYSGKKIFIKPNLPQNFIHLDFILNLLFHHSNQLDQEVHEVLSLLWISLNPLASPLHWWARKAELTLGPISKVDLQGKFLTYFSPGQKSTQKAPFVN